MSSIKEIPPPDNPVWDAFSTVYGTSVERHVPVIAPTIPALSTGEPWHADKYDRPALNAAIKPGFIQPATTRVPQALNSALPARPRDTTHRLDVRQHRAANLLAVVFRGNLVTIWPRGSFISFGWGNAVSATRWANEQPVRSFYFFAVGFRPYKASKGE